jgi:hypothetical protein
MTYREMGISAAFLGIALFMSSAAHTASYFGYINSAWRGNDYFTQVANQTNVAWIQDQTTGSVVSDLQVAQNNNQKAIVDISYMFFTYNNGQWAMYPDWTVQWSAFATAIAPYQNTIVALYPIDEPNGNQVPTSLIATAVNAIHTSFPTIPIATIFTYPSSAATQYVPYMNYFDWVGIDCYSNGVFTCGSGTSAVGYTIAYQQLKQNSLPSQHLMLVPQVFVSAAQMGCCQAQLLHENSLFYALAYGDPQVVGVFPFMLETFPPSGPPDWYGLSDASNVQLQYESSVIGTNIRSGWTFPAGTTPIYRFSTTNATGDYFFTANESEGVLAAARASLVFEGFGFVVYTSSSAGMKPLYRCYYQGSHFLSSGGNCEGKPVEGLLGYTNSAQSADTAPLYRFYNPSNGSHLATTNYYEGVVAGLTLEYILGFVPIVSTP